MASASAGTVAPGGRELPASDRPGWLDDPRMSSINFLNEVIGRYPEAISFAAGAPHRSLYDGIDVGECVARFVQHLREARGFDPAAARQVLYQYGPTRGLINDLLADALRRDEGILARPDQVVVTVGCQEALFLLLRVLHGDGDSVAVVNPSYVGITGAARLLDVPVVPVDDRGDGPDLGQLHDGCVAARAAGRRVRSLYVAPDFANPSGTRVGLAARRELLALAERHDLLVIEDGTYGFTALDEQPLPTLKALDRAGRVVHVGTFSKICAPGARVGYLVADQLVRHPSGGTRALADDLATAKSMVTLNTSAISQAVVGGVLLAHGGSLAAVGRERARHYRRSLRLLLAALSRRIGPANRPDPAVAVRWNRPAGGFFVRMRLPVPVDAALLEVSAAEYGVVWTPMRDFYLDSGGDYQLRLSCSYLDDDEIEQGTDRLARFLHDVGPPIKE